MVKSKALSDSKRYELKKNPGENKQTSWSLLWTLGTSASDHKLDKIRDALYTLILCILCWSHSILAQKYGNAMNEIEKIEEEIFSEAHSCLEKVFALNCLVTEIEGSTNTCKELFACTIRLSMFNILLRSLFQHKSTRSLNQQI